MRPCRSINSAFVSVSTLIVHCPEVGLGQRRMLGDVVSATPSLLLLPWVKNLWISLRRCRFGFR